MTAPADSEESARGDSPYVGLTAYSERDADFFFGRKREIELVIANLHASRLTLLIGESGVGKSSILLAGVMHALHDEIAANRERLAAAQVDGEAPEKAPHAVALFRHPWVDPPLPHVMAKIQAAVAEATGREVAPWAPRDDVVETLRGWAGSVWTILVVLDQFEEYLLYHPQDEARDTVAGALIAVANDPTLHVNFLLSIREDSVAKLDRFKPHVPIFGNVLRVKHLGPAAAKDAIEKPLERYSELSGNGGYLAEPSLVDEVIEQVRAGSTDGASGAAATGQDGNGSTSNAIETPLLQLVMTRLWDEERRLGSRLLRRETFVDRLGGRDEIVRTQLDPALDQLSGREKDVAAEAFRHLVTPSGSKFTQKVSDLASLTDVSADEIAPILETLARGRILRPVSPPPGEEDKRYEIFHDALGPTVLDWRRRHLEQRAREDGEREAKEAARRARRRARLWAVVGILSLLLAVGVGKLRYDALQQGNIAESRALAARAQASLAVDPHAAIGLALDALEEKRTDAAERALRESMSQSRLRRVLNTKVDVFAAAVDGSGKRVLTGGADGTAQLWDVTTGRQMSRFAQHENAITAAAFSPSEPLILTASWDATARIWEASSARQRAVLKGHETALIAAAFTSDGEWVATGDTDGAVRLWRRPPGGWRTTSKPTRVFGQGKTGHTKQVNALAFSPDGSRLVSGSEDRTARIWDVRTGRLVRILRPHPRGVLDAEFSPDGKRVATTSEKTLRLFDVERGTLVESIRASTDWVATVQFRPDGHLVLTAGSDGVARAWEVATGRLLFELRGHTDGVWTATFTTDGRSVVTAGSDDSARIWDATTGQEFRGHREWVHAAAVSSDGRVLVTGAADSSIAGWNVDVPDGRAPKPFWSRTHDPSRKALNVVATDPHGERFLAAGDEVLPILRDLSEGTPVARLDEGDLHAYLVTDAAFHPRKRNVLVAVDWDGVAIEWTVRGASAVGRKRFRPKRDEITADDSLRAVAFSGDGALLATGGLDKLARVWTYEKGSLAALLDGHRGVVTHIAFHPRDEVVVTSSDDSTLRVWDAKAGGPSLKTLTEAEGPLRAVAFSHDGRLIAAGNSAGLTYVWGWPSGKLLSVMRMHADLVNSIQFTRDGRIVTASDDRTAKIYRCTTCGPLDELIKRAKRRVGRPSD